MLDTKTQQMHMNFLIEKLYNKTQNSLSSHDFIFDDPEETFQILNHHEIFIKNFALISLLGKSRFNTNGTDWLKRKSITQPSYLAATKEPFLSQIAEIIESEFNRIEDLNLNSLMLSVMRSSMSIFLKSLGCDCDPEPFVKFIEDLRPILVKLQFHSWNGIQNDLLIEIQNEVNIILEKYITLLRSDERSASLLNTFSNYFNSENNLFAAQELLMNMFAGVETSTSATAWMINRIGVSSEVQERLHNELKNNKKNQIYKKCFINETLRYFPPIPFVTRTLVKDYQLNGKNLKEGQQIIVSIIGVHHNLKYWKDPEIFDTSRSEFYDDSYNRKAFIPFILGPRTCGGLRLAQIELSVLFDKIIEKFRFHNSRDHIVFEYALALRPQFPDQFEIVRR